MKARPRLLVEQGFDAAMGVFAVVGVMAVTAQIEPSEGDRILDSLAYAARGYPGGPVFVTLFVALHSLATVRDRRFAFAAAAAAAGALVAVSEVADTGPGLEVRDGLITGHHNFLYPALFAEFGLPTSLEG